MYIPPSRQKLSVDDTFLPLSTDERTDSFHGTPHTKSSILGSKEASKRVKKLQQWTDRQPTHMLPRRPQACSPNTRLVLTLHP